MYTFMYIYIYMVTVPWGTRVFMNMVKTSSSVPTGMIYTYHGIYTYINMDVAVLSMDAL